MIRRNLVTRRGRPAWALISQVDHARISAQLARHWREDLVWAMSGSETEATVPPDETRQEIFAAIKHHDDGWQSWERSPGIDPERLRPRSFTEMPLADSLTIWTDCIAVADTIGPLALWMVAGHFVALLAHSSDADHAAAQDWLGQMQKRRGESFARWPLGGSAQHRQWVAERALRLLQLVDGLSLWLCCECPWTGEAAGDAKPCELPTPYGPELRLEPQDSSEPSLGSFVAARPWPWDVETLRVQTPAGVLLEAPYHDAKQLFRELSGTTLEWRLELPADCVGR